LTSKAITCHRRARARDRLRHRPRSESSRPQPRVLVRYQVPGSPLIGATCDTSTGEDVPGAEFEAQVALVKAARNAVRDTTAEAQSALHRANDELAEVRDREAGNDPLSGAPRAEHQASRVRNRTPPTTSRNADTAQPDGGPDLAARTRGAAFGGTPQRGPAAYVEAMRLGWMLPCLSSFLSASCCFLPCWPPVRGGERPGGRPGDAPEASAADRGPGRRPA